MENGGVCDIKILRCLRKFEIFWYFYENWRDSEDYFSLTNVILKEAYLCMSSENGDLGVDSFY